MPEKCLRKRHQRGATQKGILPKISKEPKSPLMGKQTGSPKVIDFRTTGENDWKVMAGTQQNASSRWGS